MESPEERIRRLAKMAHLSLTDDEVARLAKDLPALEAHMKGVDDAPSETEGGLPAPTCGESDTPRPSLPHETVMDLAPETREGYIWGSKPDGR